VAAPAIELRELSKRFGGVLAVDRVSLEVAEGECLVLLGGSGSGKTTTLKMVNRLLEPSGGCVRIDGEDAALLPGPELRRRSGYCFQGIGLFPHLSVAQNVGVTPSLLGWDPARIRRRVDELLELVELDPARFRERRPHQLSGGQAQRVGLARALAAQPRVLLLDEPFGALDPLTRDRLRERFAAIRARLRLATVFVTHDMFEALRLGDRIAVLHEGRLQQVGTPAALVRSPATPIVAELLDSPRRQLRALERWLRGPGEGA
jgi:osmoprotectant transport system ATP-binding protein